MENWLKVGTIDEIPASGARKVTTPMGNVAVFRTVDGRIYALKDQCPHRGGPLSQGMVYGHKVACAMHGLNLDLASGKAIAPDQGHAETIDVRIEGSTVYLSLSSIRQCACAA